MNNELHEVAYGSYEPCQRCGMSELTTPGWGCVCALLIDAGNCVHCMRVPDRCTCALRMHRQIANADESEISSLAISFAADAPSLLLVASQPTYGGIPGENGVPPLTAQERAGLWRGLPSPRFRM